MMEKAWKMFVTDSGLNSYQNETLEQRDFYRVIILLQNNFKDRMSEKQALKKSLLYGLVQCIYKGNWKLENEEQRKEQVIEYDDNNRTFYIDGSAVYIGWCTCGGVSITAQKPEGNPKIAEIANILQTQDVWWNR